MRIAFALTVSLDSPYGGGRVLPWARELARRGHDVHIAALHHDLRPETPRRFTLDGVQVHYAGQMHTRKVGDATLYFGLPRLAAVLAAGTVGLARALPAIRPDVIHIGKPHPQNSAAAWPAARALGESVLLLDYDDLEAASNRTSGAWQVRLLDGLERGVPRLVDGVSVHSTFLAARLAAAGVPAEYTLRLPSCVEIARFAGVPAAEVAARRAALGLDGRRVVLYAGTLSQANHPVDVLIRAFALAAPACPDAHLLLVGGGGDLGALQGLARDLGIAGRCTFVGRQPAAALPAFYHMAEFSVDPVHDDDVARARWPLKIVESMAAGTPVLSGAVGDRAEMLGCQGGRLGAGWLVAPSSVGALAAGMATLLGQPGLLARLRANCAAEAARYAAGPVVDRLEAWYRARVGRP